MQTDGLFPVTNRHSWWLEWSLDDFIHRTKNWINPLNLLKTNPSCVFWFLRLFYCLSFKIQFIDRWVSCSSVAIWPSSLCNTHTALTAHTAGSKYFLFHHTHLSLSIYLSLSGDSTHTFIFLSNTPMLRKHLQPWQTDVIFIVRVKFHLLEHHNVLLFNKKRPNKRTNLQ